MAKTTNKKPNAQQLLAAINRHNGQLLRELLGKGADPNGCVRDTYHGDTPVLYLAAGGQFLEGVKLFLDAGADLRIPMSGGQGTGGSSTALHAAISGSDTRRGTETRKSTEDDRFQIVDLLLRAGSDPNAVAQSDKIPIHEAARAGQMKIVERLIEAGATFKTWPAGCMPPLVGAACVPLHGVEEGRAQERVAKLLLDLGTPVDGQTASGVTAVLVAAGQASERLLDLFLAHGADVNHRSQDGRTPLINAALYARWAAAEDEYQLALRVVRRLAEAGADPTARNSDGETAYQIAAQGKATVAADFLKGQFERASAVSP